MAGESSNRIPSSGDNPQRSATFSLLEREVRTFRFTNRMRESRHRDPASEPGYGAVLLGGMMGVKRTKRVGSQVLWGGMFVLLALATMACGDDGQERVPLEGPESLEEMESELPTEIQEQLDSANVAYRSGAYEEALDLFQEVTRRAPGTGGGLVRRGNDPPGDG
jgi:hypothetical protein